MLLLQQQFKLQELSSLSTMPLSLQSLLKHSTRNKMLAKHPVDHHNIKVSAAWTLIPAATTRHSFIRSQVCSYVWGFSVCVLHVTHPNTMNTIIDHTKILGMLELSPTASRRTRFFRGHHARRPSTKNTCHEGSHAVGHHIRRNCCFSAPLAFKVCTWLFYTTMSSSQQMDPQTLWVSQVLPLPPAFNFYSTWVLRHWKRDNVWINQQSFFCVLTIMCCVLSDMEPPHTTTHQR